MIRRATIKDAELINRIIVDPDVYPFIVDDGSPGIEEADASGTLAIHEVFTLLPTEKTVISFRPDNSTTYEVHIFSLPEDRANTEKNAKKAIKYMFTETACEKIVARIPSYNLRAYATAIKAGFKKEGIDRKSFKKDGILYDRILMGITKEEWQCLS